MAICLDSRQHIPLIMMYQLGLLEKHRHDLKRKREAEEAREARTREAKEDLQRAMQDRKHAKESRMEIRKCARDSHNDHRDGTANNCPLPDLSTRQHTL